MYSCLLFFMFISDKLQHAKYDIKKLVYLLRKIYENPQYSFGDRTSYYITSLACLASEALAAPCFVCPAIK